MDYNKEFINGAKWNSIRMIMLTITQFLTIIIVGKFISPNEYGLYGMVSIFIGLAYVFVDAGFSNAIIYNQEDDIKKLSTVFWVNMLVGLLIAIIICIVAPIASYYYKEPQLTKLIMISSVNFILLPLSQLFISISKKNLEFKKIAIIDIITGFFQIVATIIFAINGLGVLALIYSKIAQSFLSSILYYLVNIRKYKIEFYFNIFEIKNILGFGIYQIADRVTNYIKSNIDYLIIGRFLGAEVLGIYTLAYQLITMPILRINPVLTDTAFPIFVKLKKDNITLNKSYYKLLCTISYIIMPTLGFIFTISPEFINLFYGDQWYTTIIIMRIFCLMGITISLGNPIGCLLNTQGRPDIGFKWNSISMVIIAMFNIVGIKWGIIGVAISSAVYNVCISWPVDFFIRYKICNMKIREYFSSIKNPLLISFMLFIIGLISKKIIYIMNNFIITMIFCGVVYLISYVLLIRKFQPKLYLDLKLMLFLKLNIVKEI